MDPVTLALAKSYTDAAVRPQLLQHILSLSDLRFCWPLQEFSGTTAADASGNGRIGTFNGPTLGVIGPSHRVDAMVRFDGINDVITAAAGCSVRGLSTVTFMAIVEVVDTSNNKTIWYESQSGSSSMSRFNLSLNANEQLNVVLRSATNPNAQTVASNSGLSIGVHMIHVTVDIPNDDVNLFVDGSEVAVTGTPDFGDDTTFEDTAPAGGPRAGSGTGSNPWFAGDMAYIAMWSRVLSESEIQALARIGGFAA